MNSIVASGPGKLEMNGLKRILYAGPFRFPNGDAGAQRVLGVGRALRELGLTVEFAGWAVDDGKNSAGVFEGFTYRNLPEFRTGGEGAIRRLVHHLREGEKTLQWIRQNASPGDAVVLYNWYGPSIWKTIRWCRAKGIPVIVDSVEWYAPHQCAGGPFGMVRWEVEWSLRAGFRKADGIIAISSFLDKHFATTSPTVRIPPLVDLRDRKWTVDARPRADANRIQLCYCGFPGKKDNLANLFSAFAQIGPDASIFSLILIGPQQSQIDRLLVELGVPRPANLVCPGKLSHHEALQALGAADYSVLIRPDQRYAHAGFSTKFVESLAVGTPPFCNLTSDIAEYTEDGTDSIHLKSDSAADIAAGLRRIASLTPTTHGAMREAAKQTAARRFAWQDYPAPLGRFLNRIACGKP